MKRSFSLPALLLAALLLPRAAGAFCFEKDSNGTPKQAPCPKTMAGQAIPDGSTFKASDVMDGGVVHAFVAPSGGDVNTNKSKDGNGADWTTEQSIQQMEQLRARLLADNPKQARRINYRIDGVIKSLKEDPEGNKSFGQDDLTLLETYLDTSAELSRVNWQLRKGNLNEQQRHDLEDQKKKLQAQAAETMDPIMKTGLPYHTALMPNRDGGEPDTYAPGHVGDWVNTQPNNPDAHVGAGDEARGKGDIQGAYNDASRALELDPTDKAAFATMKLAQGRGARPGGAAGSVAGQGTNGAGSESGSGGPRFGQASSAAPLFAPLPEGAAQSDRLVREAQSKLTMRDYNAARGLADKALGLYSQNAQAYHVKASADLSTKRYADASANAAAGLKVAPKNKALLSARAMAAIRSRDQRAALEAANHLLESDPRSADGMAYRAAALGLKGDKEGMLEALRGAASLDARYQASLQSALQMPDDNDLLFLFPGEDAFQAGGAAASGEGRRGSFGFLSVAALVGGLLIGLGLFSSFFDPMTATLKSVFTSRSSRSPAVTIMRAEDRESLAPEPVPAAEEGLLRGQYRLGKQIGAGGMGLVFEGEDTSLGRRVAVKKMRDEIRLDRRERQRFVTEAKVVAALHHANIVDIYAITEEGDDVYLVFEYVTGKTAYELIGQRGALSYREALGIFRGMASALDFAHSRGIIHRDLKPSNVMVDDEGYVKVMDFGIARAAKDAATKVSMTNTITGTPPYMAPEQEQGVVRKESDVYALAVCLYEMLCGKLPFTGSGAGMLMNKVNMSYVPVSKMAPGLPAGLDDILAAALQPDPDKRYRSAKEMLSALNDLVPPDKKSVNSGQPS